jgi:hypothetical protein
MNLQENIRRILEEESLKQTLRERIMKRGIKTTANLMTVSVKELLDIAGMKGTKEDMTFITKSIMENEVRKQVKYCSYNIVPSLYSITLYVFIPKPLPEDEGVWTLDQGVRYRTEEIISGLLSKLGGGLIRGHSMYVYNTGDC